MKIRVMNISDYEEVYALWMSSKNMGFNNLDDSKEGIGEFIKQCFWFSNIMKQGAGSGKRMALCSGRMSPIEIWN